MAVEPTHVKPDDARLKLNHSAVDFARERNAALKTHFGFDSFHPGQAETLDSLQQGRDALAVLPTGSGKTLIYELATYLLNVPCLIVSPLLSLMQDQVGRLNQRGESRAVAINSTLTLPERTRIIERLNQFRFIFVSPEMLLNENFLAALMAHRPGLMVVDEAHCISTWGPDFRPAYMNLGNVREQLGYPLTLAITATADHHVEADIQQTLQLDANRTVVRESVDRPNIFLNVEKFNSRKDKATRLLDLVKQTQKPGIIYFSSKQQADEWATQLNGEGISAASYHAGLDMLTRYTVQQQFMNNAIQVVCATSAFGMGIDKSDIRFVIHYHMPGNLLDYIQEIGRAGRDGRQSIATLLVAPGDEQLAADLSELQVPDTQRVAQIYAGEKIMPGDEPAELISYYKKHNFTEQELNELMKQRLQSHKVALGKLKNYIDESTCLRAVLLASFGEKAPVHNEACCSVGHQTVDIAQLNLQSTQTHKSVKIPGWQEQFVQLFSENFIN